jgi:hypothetical protein
MYIWNKDFVLPNPTNMLANDKLNISSTKIYEWPYGLELPPVQRPPGPFWIIANILRTLILSPGPFWITG